jgi:hypothetical protein
MALVGLDKPPLHPITAFEQSGQDYAAKIVPIIFCMITIDGAN